MYDLYAHSHTITTINTGISWYFYMIIDVQCVELSFAALCRYHGNVEKSS